MPALPSLRPTSVALTTNVVVVGVSDASVALSDSDPSTVVAGDTTYVYDSGTSNGDLGLHITDMPADFSRVQSPLTVRAVTQAVGFTDDTDVLSVQIFDSTGNTAYTNAVTLSQRTQGGTQDTTKAVRTASLTVNATGLAAGKAAWDGARLRLIWTYTTSMAKDNGSIQVWAVEVDGNYTQTVTTTLTKTHSVDASFVRKRTRTHSVDASFYGKRLKAHGVDASIVSLNVAPIASFTASPNPVSDEVTPITLTSTSTDSDGTIVSYLWELVSGPSGGSFNTPTASSAIFTPGSAPTLLDTADYYWNSSDLATNDTVWLDRISGATMTLGKAAVLDTNGRLVLDSTKNGGTRNYGELPTATHPVMTPTTGAYTILVSLNLDTQSTVPIWGHHSAATNGAYMYFTSTVAMMSRLRGTIDSSSSITGIPNSAAYQTYGWRYNAPTVSAYVSTVGVTENGNATGNTWTNAPVARIGQYGYGLFNSLDADIGAVAIWHRALSNAELDEAAALMEAA